MTSLYDLRKEKTPVLLKTIQTLYEEPIKIVSFEDSSIKACRGCWDCWLKMPGQCVISDAMSAHYDTYMNSDTVILLMDTSQGFINHLSKAFIDRTIPHYHPYIQLVKGECHHQARYDAYPDLVFHYQTEDLTQDEAEVIELYLSRTAYHYKSKAYRFVNHPKPTLLELKHRVAKHREVPFSQTDPNAHWIIYQGSPRTQQSNSQIILNHVVEVLGDKVEVRDLKRQSDWGDWAQSFAQEQNVLFFMPLYVHAMPSHVMRFIETLPASEGNIAFFIQSGFPESSQSHYLEGYFEQLSIRLKRHYLGTAIKGGVESLQYRPPKATQAMISQMSRAIEHLVEEGYYHPDHIKVMRMPVKFTGMLTVIFSLVMKLGIINKFWDRRMHHKQAYEERNAQPYAHKRL